MTSPAHPSAPMPANDLPLEAIVGETIGREAARELSGLLPVLVQDLTEIDWRLQEVLGSKYSHLTEAARYACSTGGKRIRPLLMAATFRGLGQESIAPIRSLCAASQLIHTATLVHDDVIDHAETRRGQPSMPRAFGIPLSIVTGDYLFVRAFQLAAEYSRSIILRSAEACAELVEGEVLQDSAQFDLSRGREHYFRVIERKTASLIASALGSVVEIAGSAPALVTDAIAYGRALGIAFQIRDDLLDIYGDPDLIGKPLYSDLREGNPTLLTIEAYHRLDPKHQGEFERLFQLRRKRTRHLLRLRELTDSTDAASEVEAEARRWSERAIGSLGRFPLGPYRTFLEWLARGAAERRY
jgi:octaprenyl-diphosphate synthase